MAEASIASVLAAVEEDFADRGRQSDSGGVAVVVLGSLASSGAVPGEPLDVRFVYEGSPAKHHQALCRRFRKALRALSSNNLLLAPAGRGGLAEAQALADFAEQIRSPASGRDLLALARARRVFVAGDAEVGDRVGQAMRDALGEGAARDLLVAELREANNGVERDLLSVAEMRGGLRDLERAALYLQLMGEPRASEMQDWDAGSVFLEAGERGLIAADDAEQLAEAAALSRNLHSLLRLLPGDGFAVDTTTSETKAAIAGGCGLDDFDALVAAVHETGPRAVAHLDALARVTAS